MRYGRFETPSFNNTNPANLLTNGDFKHWSAGDNEPPDNWGIFEGTPPGSVAKESSIVKIGSYSAAVTSGGDHTSVGQVVFENNTAVYWRNRTLTFGCWVWADVVGVAGLMLNDDVTDFWSVWHPGDSTWHWLTVTGIMGHSATAVQVQLAIELGKKAYFDGAILVEGTSAFAFGIKPAKSSLNGVIDPTTITPDFIGQVYVNTAPIYGATGVFISNGLNVGDWVSL